MLPGKGYEMSEYKTTAEPRQTAPDGALVFCRFDDIVNVSSLKPNPENPNMHGAEQLELLGKIIKKTGWRAPITVSKRSGLITKGHGRRLAAIKAGIEYAPVEYQDYASEEEEHADLIADNRIAELAEMDDEKLSDLLRELDSIDDFDMDLTGFDEESLLDMIGEQVTSDDIEEDEVPEPETNVFSRTGDLWILGKHRLLCGDSTKEEEVNRLMGGQQADLYITDPPYNVSYTGKTKDALTIENDEMADGDFRQFLIDSFAAADGNMKPGAAFYIWHADSEGYNFRGSCKDVGWDVKQCLIWNKNTMVLGRQDYQWKHEPCQPAGTMVETVNGPVAIEKLKDGDRVITFDTYSGQVKGYKNGGYEVKTASRDYTGFMYSVNVAGRCTKATNNHKFSVRFNSRCKQKYCTYVMKRGDWWRVGQARAYDSRQFGLKTRIHQEKGDAVWLIGMYEDKIQAQVAEQILSVKYGIPYTVWETDRFTKAQRTKEQISQIYEAFDLREMKKRAISLLKDYGRDFYYPLITKENGGERFSTRVTAKINACNLIPGLMQLPIPRDNHADSPNFDWIAISDVTYEKTHEKVYSLSVEKCGHYIADGIITHNCLYGWKPGASHNWYSDRKQTTVIDMDKPQRNGEHPTMKPVKLFAYLIQNSSKEGDIVLDSFGGSGTTIMACEKMEREARLMELDPRYVDVIVRRYIRETGDENVKVERNGELIELSRVLEEAGTTL